VNNTEVQGDQLTRPSTAAPAASTAATPTLPNTGDGTLETALAGFGALVVGAAALWWGARHGREHASADLAD
jgi:LPXTG-motif cell wall-anchored protein